MNRRLVLGALLVSGLAGTALATHASGQHQTTSQARAALEAFFAERQSSYVVPATAEAAKALGANIVIKSGTTKTIGKAQAATFAALRPPTAAELHVQDLGGRDDFKKLATGAALTRSIADQDRITAALAADPTDVALDGGAHDTKTLTLTDDGTRIDVTAKVTAWSLDADIQADGTVVLARPENTLDVTATLVRGPGRLLVSDYTWHFAPGSEP